jgi:hypothetical protein
MLQDSDHLIEKFLENELSEEEVKLFKSQYYSDPEFKKAVNEHSRIYVALKTASRLYEQKMTVVSKPEEKKVKNLREIWQLSGTVLRIAAVLILFLLVSSLMYIFTFQRITVDNFANNGFKNALNKENIKSFSNDNNLISNQVQNRIDNSILESLDELSGEGETFRFGLYSIQNKRFNEAIIALRRVSGGQDRTYREESEWLLALCYLKTGDLDKAKATLQSISNSPSHKFQRESGKLLRKIK